MPYPERTVWCWWNFMQTGLPHYEWLEPVVRTYEKQVSEVIKVNIVEDKAVADSFNIETAPAFILLQRGHELWRQVGELTIDELKLVLEEFK